MTLWRAGNAAASYQSANMMEVSRSAGAPSRYHGLRPNHKGKAYTLCSVPHEAGLSQARLGSAGVAKDRCCNAGGDQQQHQRRRALSANEHGSHAGTSHDGLGRFGPFQIVRPLRPCALGERWLALHERDQSSHTVYRLGPFHDKAERRRFLHAVSPLAGTIESPCPGHVLPIEHYAFDHRGYGWAVTPYTGNQHGLVTLADLIRAKAGQFEPAEASRVIQQLLTAFEGVDCHEIHHGPIEPAEILVDTRGRLLIELFGVGRKVAGLGSGNEELTRDEIRSVAALGYQLMTGLPAEEPRIAASRLNRRIDKAWDEWFELALDPQGGFDTAADALAVLPGAAQPSDQQIEAKPAGEEPAPSGKQGSPVVRAVLRRFRSASKPEN